MPDTDIAIMAPADWGRLSNLLALLNEALEGFNSACARQGVDVTLFANLFEAGQAASRAALCVLAKCGIKPRPGTAERLPDSLAAMGLEGFAERHADPMRPKVINGFLDDAIDGPHEPVIVVMTPGSWERALMGYGFMASLVPNAVHAYVAASDGSDPGALADMAGWLSALSSAMDKSIASLAQAGLGKVCASVKAEMDDFVKKVVE